jgi:hypothetical protein
MIALTGCLQTGFAIPPLGPVMNEFRKNNSPETGARVRDIIELDSFAPTIF